MNEVVTQPLVLQRKSRSSRFAKFSGEANTIRDKLLRSLYVFLLVALDFIMFIYSINGRLIEGGEFNQALLVILGSVFLFSLVVILLFSFSKDMQNAFCALMTMIMTAIFFYQFGLNNVDNFMEIWFKKHMSWLSFFCIVPSPWLVGFFFGLAIFFLFRFSDAILFVTVVLLFSGVIGVQKNEYLSQNNSEYQEVSPLPGDVGVVSDNSMIYLMMPHLPSYQFLNTVRDINFREVRDLLIGFYAANNFEIYPNAFVLKNDEMSNVIDILNQVDYTSATSSNRGFAEFINDWNFIHGGLDKYSLEENKLFDHLEAYGYGVSMYAMPEFNFCVKNGAFATDRCVIKGYKTVSIYDKNATKEQNLYALLGEWILSLKSRDLKSMAKSFIGMSPLKNMKILSENRRVSIEGSPFIFSKLSNDYLRDQGGQAYIVYVDLPSDIFIYDEYCNLKPRKDWVALKDNSLYSGGIDEKRKAYADQTKCLVGKLQEFMDSAQFSPKFRRTDIYIQGLSTIRELAGVRGDDYHQFVTDNLVNLAVRKGKNPRFLINANICLASDFTKSMIRYQDYCYSLDNMKKYATDSALSVNMKKNLINNSVIRGSKISNIMDRYKDWLELYRTNNKELVARKKKEQAEEEARLKRAQEEESALEEAKRIQKARDSEVRSRSQNNANIFVPTDEPSLPNGMDIDDDFDLGFEGNIEETQTETSDIPDAHDDVSADEKASEISGETSEQPAVADENTTGKKESAEDDLDLELTDEAEILDEKPVVAEAPVTADNIQNEKSKEVLAVTESEPEKETAEAPEETEQAVEEKPVAVPAEDTGEPASDEEDIDLF